MMRPAFRPPGARTSLRQQEGLRWLPTTSIFLIVGAAMIVPMPHAFGNTRLTAILDLGHFLGFAALAASLAWVRPRRRWAAAASLIALAALGEMMQSLVGRTPHARDFAFSALGVLAGMCLVRGFAWRECPGQACLYWSAVAALAAWPLASCLPDLLDSQAEYRSFPVLCDFESRWQARRWFTSGVVLRRQTQRNTDAGTGRFASGTGSGARPLAVLFPLRRDWTGYRRLVWEVRAEEKPLNIGIRIRVGRGEEEAIRVRFPDICDSAVQRIAVELERTHGRGESLDLSDIHSVLLDLRGQPEPFALIVDKIYLE